MVPEPKKQEIPRSCSFRVLCGSYEDLEIQTTRASSRVCSQAGSRLRELGPGGGKQAGGRVHYKLSMG